MRISDWSSDVCSSDLQQLSEENDQLQSLRISARQFAGNYHSLKAAMNARLQVGTTPGNPELVAQWNQAQAELQQVGASIAALNTLASPVSGPASLPASFPDSDRKSDVYRKSVSERVDLGGDGIRVAH